MSKAPVRGYVVHHAVNKWLNWQRAKQEADRLRGLLDHVIVGMSDDEMEEFCRKTSPTEEVRWKNRR